MTAATYVPPQPKVCKACGIRKEPAAFDPARRWPDGSVRYLASKCKPCRRQESNRSRRAAWAANREEARRKQREKRRQQMADPAFRARDLRQRRERRAIAAAQAGRTLRLLAPPANPTERLPARPLLDAMARLAELEQRDVHTIARRAGMRDRLVYELTTRQEPRVSIETADRALLNLDLLWWEVWDPQAHPDVQQIFEPEATAA